MKSEMKSELSSLRMKPKVAVVFGTGAPEQYTAHSHVWEDHLPRCQHTWLVNTEHVTELLPRDCVTIGTTSRGIVGLDYQRKGVEVENLDDSTREFEDAASIMLIPEPQKPGVKVLPFHISEKHLETLVEDIKENTDSRLRQSDIQEELLKRLFPDLDKSDNIKCLVSLSNGLDLPYNMNIIQAVNNRCRDQVAVGGAVGDLTWSSLKTMSTLEYVKELFHFTYNVEPYYEENVYMQSSGFIITGDKVQAASVLINRHAKKEKVKKELQKLKDSGINEDCSFALMFACCARGEHFHGQKNFEVDAFTKMFPKTPIAGIFGNGEIGVNHIPDFKTKQRTARDDVAAGDENEKKFKSERKLSHYQHSYSTIFVMVSYGNV